MTKIVLDQHDFWTDAGEAVVLQPRAVERLQAAGLLQPHLEGRTRVPLGSVLRGETFATIVLDTEPHRDATSEAVGRALPAAAPGRVSLDPRAIYERRKQESAAHNGTANQTAGAAGHEGGREERPGSQAPAADTTQPTRNASLPDASAVFAKRRAEAARAPAGKGQD